MRDIYNTEIERKIIDRICNDEIFMGVHMSTLLTDHIPNLILSLNTDEQSIQLIIKQNEDIRESQKQFHFQTAKIIYIIKFILQLEEEGLIITGYFAHGRVVEGKFCTQGTNDEYSINKSKYDNWNFPDPRMQKFIFEYVDQTIMPTSNLLAFKKRGYRTKEDKRHDENIKVAKWGIILALIFGVLGFYQNLISDGPSGEQVDTIINELNENHCCDSLPSRQQVDTIIKKIQQSQYTDSLTYTKR